MGVLTRNEIKKYFAEGKLIRNARRTSQDFDVEAASYDLSVGIAVSKKHNKKLFQKRHEILDYDTLKGKIKTITLSPGQMVFVITREEIIMPDNLCGTVYSRNSLAQKGILALNAGHIDPGFNGPITIKLINLRSVDYTLTLGEPIFTIVFHTLEKFDNKPFESNYRLISKEETIKRVTDATDLSLDNALYDLALLREFVKESEFGRALRRWAFKTAWGIIAIIFTGVLTLIGASVSILKLLDALKTAKIIKP